ncbi:MAG: ATP-binding domain-containing protein [Chitinophagales bacterium]|nr:ATP-binding domain-containing protein [Chitinophagales bacterium]
MIKSFQVMANEQNAYDIAHHIAKSSGILKELYTDKSIEGLSRFENLQELLNGINEFVEEDTVEIIEESTATDKSLATYLQNIALLTSDDLVKDKTDSVRLMTIHSAKGLEFENVFIVGLEENLFPSAMSLNTREDLEEERRLFYVAVTRAMKNLTLSFATTRFKFGNLQYCEPSRFLEELPEEILESNSAFKKPKPDQTRTTHVINRTLNKPRRTQTYKPDPNFVADEINDLPIGSEVIHQRFGKGKVTAMDGGMNNRIATIEFESAGQKKIMLKYAKLKLLQNNDIS